MLLDRPIWIFDEATSALDLNTERQVIQAVRTWTRARNRTLVVIAHRLSTIRDADVIYVMEEGRIREHGTHDELITNHQLYRQLQAQSEGLS
jgi:ABC-type multidrug transport system fused ATPase/permease subunit